METWNQIGGCTLTLTQKYNSMYYNSINWTTLTGFKTFENGSVNIYANDNNGLWLGAIRKVEIKDDTSMSVTFYIMQPLTAATTTKVTVQAKMYLVGTWK